MKEFTTDIIVGASLVGLITGGVFLFGKVGNRFEETIGTEYKNIKREQFENSTSYVHGTIKELSKLKMEYELSETEEEKRAISNYIKNLVSTFDINYINNSELRNFVLDIIQGNI